MRATYGIEENGFTVYEDEGGVIISETNFPLISEHILQLQQEINPLAQSQNHGVNYMKQQCISSHRLLIKINHFICNDIH